MHSRSAATTSSPSKSISTDESAGGKMLAPRTKKRKITGTKVMAMLGLTIGTLLTILLCVVGLFYHSIDEDNNNSQETGADGQKLLFQPPLKKDPKAALQLLKEFKNDFEKRYTPKLAPLLLQNGLTLPQDSIQSTAQRLLDARLVPIQQQQKQQQQNFTMGFAGYSITVGRGNFFHQSYPLVLQTLLRPFFDKIFDLHLVVHNSAIGGIPSFPYAFCFSHFLGSNVDVMSWDFAMNEGPHASVLESYIRQSRAQLPKHPMMILLDSSPQRSQLLHQYHKLGYLPDFLILQSNVVKRTVPKQYTQEEKNNDSNKDSLPLGFQDWNEFGAPPSCPGRGKWHPKRKEHELYAWLLAMHFVNCMEEAIRLHQQQQQQHVNFGATTRNIAALATRLGGTLATMGRKWAPSPLFFGKPLSDTKNNKNNPKAVTQLLYGHDEQQGEQQQDASLITSDNVRFRMKDLSCRTSFLPAMDHDKILPSIIVDGFIERAEYQDIMQDRPDSLYKDGWVLDVSQVERTTKRKVTRCGGLGYIDMKIALYGTFDSGPLKLWLPYEGPSRVGHLKQNHDESSFAASQWFDDLIICEANEKRSDEACQLDRDLQISVGGHAIETSNLQMLEGVGTYLNRKTCLYVPIPKEATVTRLDQVETNHGKPLSLVEKERLAQRRRHKHQHQQESNEDETKRRAQQEQNIDDTVGLHVIVEAKSTVTRKKGACCISHVVWENH